MNTKFKISIILLVFITVFFTYTTNVSAHHQIPEVSAHCDKGGTHSGLTVTVEWHQHPGATSHRISRGGTVLAHVPMPATFWQHENAPPNTFIEYLIKPNNEEATMKNNITTGTCAYMDVSNFQGPDSVIAGSSVSYSAQYDWISTYGKYTFLVYSNYPDNSTLIARSDGELSSNPQTVSVPYNFPAAGTYLVCLQGGSEPDLPRYEWYTEILCKTVTVSPAPPAGSVALTANGQTNTSIEVGSNATMAWTPSGFSPDSCEGKVNSGQTVPNWGPNEQPQSSGKTVGPFSQANSEYKLQISCTSSQLGSNSFFNKVFAATTVNSNIVTVSTTGNINPPSADAGTSHTITAGTSHTHSGANASDIDGDLASYTWSRTCTGIAPCPSLTGNVSGNLSGSSATVPGPSFTLPSGKTGSITLVLSVTDSKGNAAQDSVIDYAVSKPVNGAAFVSQSVPTTMEAGGIYPVSVTMQNNGTKIWTNGYHLGSQNPQDNNTWGIGRISIGSDVTIGAQKTFNFNVTAPSTAGNYNFQWRMVQEYVEWFGDYSTNAVVNVTDTESFNYTLSNSGTTRIMKGGVNTYGQNVITKSLSEGTTQSVDLTLSGVPSGVSYSISNRTCSPGCQSSILFTVTPSASVGTFPITVTGSPLSKTTQFNLIIEASPDIVVSCSASPSSPNVGDTVTWTANVSGGVPPYLYSWSGTNVPTSPAPSTNPFTISYSTVGLKSAQATITDSLFNTGSCNPAGTVQVNLDPRFEEF